MKFEFCLHVSDVDSVKKKKKMAAKVISQHDVKKILKMLSTNLVSFDSSRISYVLSLLTISGNDFSDQVTIGLKLVFNLINWLHGVSFSNPALLSTLN